MIKRVFIADDLTPVSAYALLQQLAPEHPSFLLESAMVSDERWGRFSVIGIRPQRSIVLEALMPTTKQNSRHHDFFVQLEVTDLASGQIQHSVVAPSHQSLDLLRTHMFPKHVPIEALAQTPRVVGAAIGYIAYEFIHTLERIKIWPEMPRLAHFLVGATFVVFDHLLNTISIYGDDSAFVTSVFDLFDSTRVHLPSFSLETRVSRTIQTHESIGQSDFEQLIRQAKQYIEAGDIFQVVLARSFQLNTTPLDLFNVYRALRVLNPSPYLYFLNLKQGTESNESAPQVIVGASPETLVRLENHQVTVRPIAGTRPRGHDVESDRRFEYDLLADAKERAEHTMLVDLGRNDIGRIAQIGSVHVPINMSVERYSHVMHLVSEVRGTLAQNHDAWDAFAATFPAGTLSGAPKVRAMQLIRELELQPRGVYGGAVGYVSNHGTMDFAIAIRTLISSNKNMSVTAGAGIVHDSIPQAEAEETVHKSKGILHAIDVALGCKQEGTKPT